MARQVLPIAGAVIGGIVSGGNPYAIQAGAMIGSLIGNAVDPQVIKAPSLGEGQENRASEGGFRPIVLGKGAVGVCMIHSGPLIVRTKRTRQSKGGGPVTEEKRRYRTMAFALGESAYPDAGVQLLRLWIDNNLRYDVTPTSEIVAESAEFAEQFTFYPGDNTQEPDPDLEEFLGAGNVPSYKGGAPYIVFRHWDVTDSGGRAPVIKAEIASSSEIDPHAEWLMSTYHPESYSGIVKRSSDGEVWPDNIDTPPYGSREFYRDGDNILAWSGSSSVSYDNGNTWSNVTGTGSNGSNYQRAAWFGNKWWIASTIFGSKVIDGTTATNTGWNADGLCASGGYLIVVHNGTLRGRDSSGNIVWTNTGSVASNQATIALAAGDDGAFVLWRDGTQTPKLTHVPIGGGDLEDVAHPFSDQSNANVLMRWLPDMSMWVAVFGTQLAYGPDIDNLVLSSHTFHAPPSCVYANAQKAIFGFGSGQARSTTDFETFSVVDTHLSSSVLVRSFVTIGGSDFVAGEPIPLSSIVSFCHDRVGMDTSKYDVSALTDLVDGVVFADGYTSASAIGAAMAWYQFDAGEFDGGSGYRIHYVKRGGVAVATLTEDDIVDGPEDWEREDSYERPRVLHVAYPNPTVDYGAPVIPIKRTTPDVKVVGERSVTIPFVTSDQDEIARRGDVAMTVIYTEIAGEYEIVLPDNWLTLAPTDCIGFSIRGKTRRLRMTEWRYIDGTVKCKWMADRQSAYTSNLTALPPVPPTPPPPSIVGPTVSAVLDIPALVDSADMLHLIVAASGQAGMAWYGATHQRKLPSESDYTTAATINAPTTIMGSLDDDVSDASEHFTDTTNAVRVTLYSDDELPTYTQAELLSENGAFALSWDDGGTRRWEILQYRDAVKTADRTWELTTLARGRLNTETAAHPSGSMFVLLDVGVRAITMQSAWLGQDITHRAVSHGQLPDNAIPYSETYTGQSQREWPVAHFDVAKDGDDYVLTWVPRHRFGTDDAPIRSANFDGFVVGWQYGGQVHQQIVSMDTTSITFNLPGASDIDFTVAPHNRITGEGPTTTVNIP